MRRVLEVDAPPRTPAGHIDVDRIAEAVRLVRGTPWVLDSRPGTPAATGWSAVVVGTAGRLVVPPVGPTGTPDPFAALDRRCERLGLTPTAARGEDQPPCDGGLVGAVSYDAVRAIERLPADAVADRTVPALDMVVADVVVLVDHRADRVLLLHRPLPRERSPRELRALRDRLVDALGSAHVRATPPRHRQAGTSLPPADHRAAVAAVQERIAAGDTFQVNLAQRLTSRWSGDLLQLYRALREESPAPHGAVLPTLGAGIASTSPETFLEVAGGTVRVRPIKGTRARHDDPAADRAAAEQLAASEKDRAENVMVVDLERNDLGRVCRPGTVRVPTLLELEAHPTVWHLVSEVTGELASGTSWGDLLRATFPCGSVTGAPKVSSMAVIDRLEPVRRNWYCGAFGWLGSGGASTAVAIRTAALWPDATVDYGAGGGIVADSEPSAEHAEALDKAASFLRAVVGRTDP